MPIHNEKYIAVRSAKNLAERGELNAAIIRMQRLVAQHPEDKTLAVLCATWLAKDSRGANNHAEEIISLLKNMSLSEVGRHNLYFLGDAFLQAKEFGQAARAFEHADPYTVKIVKKHGYALVMSGDYEAAREVLRHGYQRDRSIIGAIRHWASEASRQGEQDRADNILEIAAVLDVRKPPAPVAQVIGGRPRTEEFANYGDWLLVNGQPGEALQRLQRAVAREPTNVEYIIKLADVWRGQRRYGAALAVLKRGERSVPESAALMRMQGEILLETGDFHKSVNFLRRARQLDNFNPDITDLIGDALIQAENLNEAIRELEEGRKLHPRHEGISATLGIALSKAGRYGEAVTVMVNILPKRFTNARIASVFASIYIDLGQYAAFRQLVDQLSQDVLNNPIMSYVRAYAGFRLGEKEVARRILEPVIPQQRGITPSVVLYLACAEEGDAVRQQLAAGLGEHAYERALLYAGGLRVDSKELARLNPRYSARGSPVLTSGLYHRPINKGALGELVGQDKAGLD